MDLINLIKIFAYRFKNLLSYKDILIIIKLNKNFRHFILENVLFKNLTTLDYKIDYYINHIAPKININKSNFYENNSVYNKIAINGNVYILDLLFKYNFRFKDHISKYILKYVMKTELLKYLINVGFKFNIKIRRCLCEKSASNGNFEILKWLVDNGYGLNGKVCYYAKIKGHQEIVIWAHQQGRYLF